MLGSWKKLWVTVFIKYIKAQFFFKQCDERAQGRFEELGEFWLGYINKIRCVWFDSHQRGGDRKKEKKKKECYII